MITGTIALLLSILYCLIYVGSVIWAFVDAQNRGKSGCLVAVLVLILPWPVGLIVWLLIRPSRT